MNTIRQKVNEFFGQYPSQVGHKGEILLHPDQIIEYAWYVEHGTVLQYHIDQSGNKLVMNIYKAGAFLPIYLMVDSRRSDFFFEIQTGDTLLRRAPKQDVLDMLSREPDVLADLYERLARGSAGLLRRLSIHMSGTAQARLLIELLIAAERFGHPVGENTSIRRLKTTEQQLAIQAGIARETVSREFAKLTKTGLIERNGRELIINTDTVRAHLDTIA